MTRRYTPFEFGFLNTAQDPADLKDFEAVVANNLDPDKLALGTLEHEQFDSVGTLKDFTDTTMSGRRFYLGDATLADNAYTEYGQSDYYTSDPATFIELPLTTANGLKAHVIAFDFYMDTAPSNTSAHRVLSTTSGTPTAHLFKFTVENGNLVFTFYDGVTTQTIDVITSISVDTWYRIVLTHNTEVDKGYAAYVNGLLVGEQVGNTVGSGSGGELTIGGSTNPTLLYRIRNVLIARGYATSPSKYTGSLRSLGFEGDVYKVILSSRDGSGADNKQNMVFTKSGTPTSSSNETSVANGRLMFEVDASAKATSYEAYTEYDYSNANDDAAYCTRNLPFGAGVFVGLNLKLQNTSLSGEVSRKLFTFEDSGAAGTATCFLVAVEQSLTENYFTLKVGLESASFNMVDVRDIFVPGDSVYVSAVVYDDSTDTVNRYVGAVYVDGEEVFREVHNVDNWDIRNNTSVRPIFMSTNYSASSGTYSFEMAYKDLVIGNLKSDADIKRLSGWVGQSSLIEDNVDVLFSASDGDIYNNDQGFTSTEPFGYSPPTLFTPSDLTGLAVVSDLVADNDGPTTPRKVVGTTDDGLVLDDGAGSLPTGFTIQEKDGYAYEGPKELKIKIKDLHISATTPRFYSGQVALDSDGGRYRARSNTGPRFNLGHNLEVSIDEGLVVATYGALPYNNATVYEITVKAPALLDGEYKYRAVGVRYSDTSPRVEIESVPTKPTDVKINNVGTDGKRSANNIPYITVPPASPGYPDFIDRVDLYRRDPDVDEYVKIAEHSGSAEYVFEDNTILTDLPKIEFLKTNDDERFADIDDAIGNDSRTYCMVFNKDNRLWAVPTDRKDLLLYSRQDDWWGWSRENSFSFNGDIVDIVTLRDINVVNGESTIVVFTTEGIYHVAGSGTESSPYTRVPMFGADGHSTINTYAGSALPFNGSIFFISKSTDGGYDTGAYGQKAYEYNLQQLTELSGRIKGQTPLDGNTAELEYASLIGGDKYLIKKLSNTKALAYHKDARGWVTFDDDGTPTDKWTWESKRFDRVRGQQGTWADASMFKIDYEGTGQTPYDVRLTFYVKPYGQTTYQEKSVDLSYNGRTIKQNVLPANMGEKWYFKLEGLSSAKVYNMWFVQ